MSVFVATCADCGCIVDRNVTHVCFASALEHVKDTDFNEVAADHTELQVDAGWFTKPLTIVVNDRHGTHYLLDGSKDDTRVSLSSLDDVDKAAIKVLLQQALREIDPPRQFASGGTAVPGGIIGTGSINVTGRAGD